MRINKRTFCERVAKRLKVDVDTAVKVVDAVHEEYATAMIEGDAVSLTGWGATMPVLVPERNARNPQTGEVVVVPPTWRVRFRPGSRLLDLMNGRVVEGDRLVGKKSKVPQEKPKTISKKKVVSRRRRAEKAK